jgi:hypothetical protein
MDASSMPRDPATMSCAEFQGSIPDLIYSWEDLQNHPHVLRCLICSSLLRDLERIANDSRRFFSGEGNHGER